IFTSDAIVSSSAILLPFADSWHSARAAVRAAINVGGGTVQVFGAHMSNDPGARFNMMTMLRTWAGGYSTPQLGAGCFNAGMDQIDSAWAMGAGFIDSWSVTGSGAGFTCPTPAPTMKLDYWFADASGKAVAKWTNVVTSTGTLSDHFPVIANYVM